MTDDIKCSKCGNRIDTASGRVMGTCRYCRDKMGYGTHSPGCGNFTIPPGGGECAYCKASKSAVVAPTTVVAQSAKVASSTPTWQQWRDVNRAPQECACGMPKEMCDYHR